MSTNPKSIQSLSVVSDAICKFLEKEDLRYPQLINNLAQEFPNIPHDLLKETTLLVLRGESDADENKRKELLEQHALKKHSKRNRQKRRQEVVTVERTLHGAKLMALALGNNETAELATDNTSTPEDCGAQSSKKPKLYHNVDVLSKMPSSPTNITTGGRNALDEFISRLDNNMSTEQDIEEKITTPQKPRLPKTSIEYLSKRVSTDVNKKCVILKAKVNHVDIFSDAIHSWLMTALSSERNKFKEVIMTPLKTEACESDHQFRRVCEIVLYDFFSMVSEGVLNRRIGERKFTVERIVPIFKAVQSVYREYAFDWIERQINCIKDAKSLFPESDQPLHKVDGVCMKVSSNKELLFIEVSGGPMDTKPSHVEEDTEKLIKEAVFGLASLLRDYLDKSTEIAKNVCTFMIQVIGDRMTLSKLCLVGKHTYETSQMRSAILPFSFDEVEKFMSVLELVCALLNELEVQKKELKKLTLTKSSGDIPTVRDWIWVPNSIAEWKAT